MWNCETFANMVRVGKGRVPKNPVKSLVFCQTGGSGGHLKPNSRTILGHPRRVLHLVPSPHAITKAFNVMSYIGPSAPLISDFGRFGAKVNLYNRTKN